MSRSSAQQQFESGCWDPAWFLDPSRAEFGRAWEVLGLPLTKRTDANRALKRLFPPDVALRMYLDRTRAADLLWLFPALTMPGQVADLLDLGVDAHRIEAWSDQNHVDRLFWREHHEQTAFEIRVVASAQRAFLRPQRVRETSSKSHDFNLLLKGLPYAVEVKLVGDADLDAYRRHLNMRLGLMDLIIPGFRTVVRGSVLLTELVLEDIASVAVRERLIRAEFAAALGLARVSNAPGTFGAGDWGELELVAGPQQGVVEDLLLPPLPDHRRALRVVNAVRKGLKQLPGDRRGVLVIGLFGAAEPDDVQEALLSDLELAGEIARKCVMVVLCETFSEFVDDCHVGRRLPYFYAFSPLRTRPLLPVERTLAQQLASPHWARAEPMDPRVYGRIEVRHRRTAAGPRLWGGASGELKGNGDVLRFQIANVNGELVTTRL